MRYGENFNPEWGYVSPAPGFARTVRIAVVAAAVGAIAGGGVVFSLVERPEPEEASIAARTLVEPANATPATVAGPSQSAPVGSAAEDRSRTQLQPQASSGRAVQAVGSSSTNSVAEKPVNDSAAAEAPAQAVPVAGAATEEFAPGQAVGLSDTVPEQRGSGKVRRIVGQPRPAAKGPLDLLRSLAARATTWPPRAD